MRMTWLTVAGVMIAGRAASAQPANAPLRLSLDDQELLTQGEISENARVGGVVASAVVGFGVGHAIQGRWTKTGWKFTVTEGIAAGVMYYGLHGIANSIGNCLVDDPSCNDPDDHSGWIFLGGLLALGGLHIWEIVDAYEGPLDHNARVR